MIKTCQVSSNRSGSIAEQSRAEHITHSFSQCRKVKYLSNNCSKFIAMEMLGNIFWVGLCPGHPLCPMRPRIDKICNPIWPWPCRLFWIYVCNLSIYLSLRVQVCLAIENKVIKSKWITWKDLDGHGWSAGSLARVANFKCFVSFA